MSQSVNAFSKFSKYILPQENHNSQILSDYIQSQDVPLWYRGLSTRQNKAGRALLNALRDDAEQSTTHRVKDCLETLGLIPIPHDEDIETLMNVSRGNDLAFLWFLMEFQYKVKSQRYTLNEEIIMNIIAMLDMVMTMRGLDKILPPAQPPKKLMYPMRQNKRRRSSARSIIDLMASKHHPKYKLPYFDKLQRPIPYGKSLISKPAEHQMKFEFYENYANPNYTVPNEPSRWFTRPLAENNRIVKGIINKDLLGSETGEVWAERDERLCNKCTHHRIIDELQKSLKNELAVIARNRCLGIGQKPKRATRICQDLQARAELHMRDFKRLANSTLKSMSHMCLLDVDGTIDFNPNPKPPPPPPETNKPVAKLKNRKSSKRHTSTHRLKGGTETMFTDKDDIPPEGSCGVCKLDDIKPDCLKPKEYGKPWPTNDDDDDCLLYSPSEQAFGCRRIFSRPHDCKENTSKMNSLFKTCCLRSQDPLQFYDYNHRENVVSPRPSQTYFKAPCNTRPYKIDYERIFYFKNLFGIDSLREVREASMKAIDSNGELDSMHNFHESKLNAAVQQCAKRSFDERLQNYMTDREERLKESPHENVYYDPDDKAVMHRLLKEGLNRLASDTRYVLPSMPEAYKHPTLRYWIYRRFGKVFSPEELEAEWRKSSRVLRILVESERNVQLRKDKKFGAGKQTTYAYRDLIVKKDKQLRNNFYRRIDNLIMKNTRALYLAMNPYLTSRGPPWEPFFAYLPARRIDINHVGVWSPKYGINRR